MVTLTVSDGLGHSDTVHFVFSEAGQGPVTLTGTSGKDVIFATGSDDTLTGGASADQFVFAPGQNPSADTITDFTPGQDRIDLRLFSEVGCRQYQRLAVRPCGAEFDKPGGCPDHARQRSYHAEKRRGRPVCMSATSSCRRITLPSGGLRIHTSSADIDAIF